MPTTKDERYWLQVTPVTWTGSNADKWTGYLPDPEVTVDGTGPYVYQVRAGKWIALLVKNLHDVNVRFDLASQHECASVSYTHLTLPTIYSV